MSITISFTGDTPDAIRDEALKFFNASPAASEPERTTGAGSTATPDADDKDQLVARAKELGLKVDKRWSVKKLKDAIAEAETEPATPEEHEDPSSDFDTGSSEPEEEDPFSLDEPEQEEQSATKEDVRAALIDYQKAVKEKLISDGEEDDKAAKKAMNTARELLKKAGNADNLGGLDEDKFDKVVKAAKDAKSKL